MGNGKNNKNKNPSSCYIDKDNEKKDSAGTARQALSVMLKVCEERVSVSGGRIACETQTGLVVSQ